MEGKRKEEVTCGKCRYYKALMRVCGSESGICRHHGKPVVAVESNWRCSRGKLRDCEIARELRVKN